MSNLLNDFVSTVLNTNNSFVQKLGMNGNDAVFMQIPHRNGKTIYGSMHNISEHASMNDRIDMSPVAIVSDGIVYLYNLCYFEVSKDTILPANVRRLSGFHNDVNEYLSVKHFVPFYNALETNDIDEQTMRYARRKAREAVLKGTVDELTALNFGNSLNVFGPYGICGMDVDVKLLRGDMTIDELEAKFVDYLKDDNTVAMCKREKTLQLCYQMALNDAALVADWEKDMANAVLNTEAKTVMVTYERDGEPHTCQMQPKQIINCLAAHDYSHVVKITYRKRDIYTRNAA